MIINPKPITPEKANEIYDVLVAECGASPDEHRRSTFVDVIVRDTNEDRPLIRNNEYRFGGKLGSGGKFWYDSHSWRVSCYGEDETNEVKRMIEKAKARLKAMFEEYNA